MELLKIKILDLHKRIHFLNRELTSLSSSLHRLFPTFIWESIKQHHFYSFNRFKHRLILTHHKKYINLQTMNRRIVTDNINPINYTYKCTNNKFYVNKFSEITNNINNLDNIQISIDPHTFNDKPIFALDYTNNKWFLNLSNSVIPSKVFILLQLGESLSLPLYHDKNNKKTAIHEFIKDVESDLTLKKSDKQTLIKNMTIPQLYKFLKYTPSLDPLTTRLTYLHKRTKQISTEQPKYNCDQIR